MLSMGTVICAGIFPELRWTATATSGIEWVRETHGQEDEESTTSGRVWHASPCRYARTCWRHPSSTYNSYAVKHTIWHNTPHTCMIWKVLMKGSESLSTCTVSISV